MGLITLTGLVLKAALLAMAQGLHLTTPMEQVKVRNERKTTEFDNMFHSVVWLLSCFMVQKAEVR